MDSDTRDLTDHHALLRESYTSFFPSSSEWVKKHGTMPSLDLFKKVHELPKEGDADYQIRMEFLLFYLDLWLPKAAGFENFKPSIRHYRKMVDRMELPSGKKVAHVSMESEGFHRGLCWRIVMKSGP